MSDGAQGPREPPLGLRIPEDPEPLAQRDLDAWFGTSPAELQDLSVGRLTRARLRRLQAGCLTEAWAILLGAAGAWAGWTFYPAVRGAVGAGFPPWLSRPLSLLLLGTAGVAAALLWRRPAELRRRAELAMLPVQVETLELRAELARDASERVTGVVLRAPDGRRFRAPPSPRSLRVAGRYRAFWVDLGALASTPEAERGPFLVALELA